MIPVGLKLKMDGSEFQSGMDKIAGDLQNKIGAIFTLGAMTGAIKSIRDMVGAIKDASEATGVSVEAYQELNYAFLQAGAGADEFIMAMKTMAQVRERALSGDAKAIEQLRGWGHTMTTMRGTNPDEFFMRTANAIAAIQDPMSKAAAATEAFGKAGMKLLPVLGELRKLRDDAKNQNLIVSERDIELLDRIDKRWTSMKAATRAQGANLAAGMLGGGMGDRGEARFDAINELTKSPALSGFFNAILAGADMNQINAIVARRIDSLIGVDSKLNINRMRDALAKKNSKGNETYIGDVFNEEDAYFDSKAYLNALVKAQAGGSGGLGSSKLLSPEARAQVGLTQLQQVGAFAPGQTTQVFQSQLEQLTRQTVLQKQILENIRATFSGFGIRI